MTEAVDLAAPVRSVTLLEDRAAVTRVGTIAVDAGFQRLVVRGVAPSLADKSVAARIAGAARLHDVRVRRAPRALADRSTVGAGEVELRSVHDEIASLEDAIATREAAREALAVEREHMTIAAELAARDAEIDAAWSRLDAAATLAAVDAIDALEIASAAAAFDLETELRDLRQLLVDKRARAAALETPSAELDAWIEIDVEAETGATEAASIEITIVYVVPGACWRPQHTATDLGGDAPVRFACEATVWQNTGEAWADVEVVLSTARPSLGAAPPDLASDVLTVTRKSPHLVVQTREQRVEVASLGGKAPAPDAGLPGIDDGGESRRLVAKGRHDLPSDGRPHRLPILAFECSPRAGERELVTTPELAQVVFERTELVNGAPFPLLAGPVDLVRRGGPSGTSRVAYVAPGEAFHLGWGPEPNLRVRRDVEPLPEETTFFGGWTTTTEDVVIRLSNLGAEARRVVVRERVLVSEIEKIQVQVIAAKTTSGKTPDEDGFLSWTIDVPPHGREIVRVRTSIKRHADVVG